MQSCLYCKRIKNPEHHTILRMFWLPVFGRIVQERASSSVTLPTPYSPTPTTPHSHHMCLCINTCVARSLMPSPSYYKWSNYWKWWRLITGGFCLHQSCSSRQRQFDWLFLQWVVFSLVHKPSHIRRFAESSEQIVLYCKRRMLEGLGARLVSF